MLGPLLLSVTVHVGLHILERPALMCDSGSPLQKMASSQSV